jgi:hypothetical protein
VALGRGAPTYVADFGSAPPVDSAQASADPPEAASVVPPGASAGPAEASVGPPPDADAPFGLHHAETTKRAPCRLRVTSPSCGFLARHAACFFCWI